MFLLELAHELTGGKEKNISTYSFYPTREKILEIFFEKAWNYVKLHSETWIALLIQFGNTLLNQGRQGSLQVRSAQFNLHPNAPVCKL